MSRKLFWKLCISISLISMTLVYLIAEISLHTERQMSMVSEPNKQQLLAYRGRVDTLVQAGDLEGLAALLKQIETEHNTFATVIELKSRELVPIGHASYKPVNIELGRDINWPIHLSHAERPAFEFPLTDGINTLVIQLPEHMMPGSYWSATHLFLHLIAPMLLMVVVSVCLYRHLMRPLSKLEQATQQFALGNYDARVLPDLGGRDDELGRLARTFDEMAARVGTLVRTQRHLINDLSHELRTPLQRIELCLQSNNKQHHERLKKEAGIMRRLVEDTLTLAWLENESPDIRTETVDLVGLIEAIAEDTRYEFPDRYLELKLPEFLEVHDSSEKALNMALENIIRNAMRYTPVAGTVTVQLDLRDDHCEIQVLDQGPGVLNEYLELIFKPFFRVDKSRERDRGGFGLGLALARRQISGVAGNIHAVNRHGGGLNMVVQLPLAKVH